MGNHEEEQGQYQKICLDRKAVDPKKTKCLIEFFQKYHYRKDKN